MSHLRLTKEKAEAFLGCRWPQKSKKRKANSSKSTTIPDKKRKISSTQEPPEEVHFVKCTQNSDM